MSGEGSLIGDACGPSDAIYVVGGYVAAKDGALRSRATYSATGPTRGARSGPRFLARSEENAATRGVSGPGTRSGLVHRVWGTSVAAPQAARALVNDEPLPDRTNTTLPVEEAGNGFLP